MSVGKIISKQINTIDPMAFFTWGSSDLVAFPENENDRGALRWKVRNCRTFKGTAFVKVTLDFSDTYSVKLYKHKNYTKALRAKVLEGTFNEADLERVIDERSDVYVDQLVQAIDDMLGEETKKGK